MRNWLADSGQSCSVSCLMVEVQVHRRIVRTAFWSGYDRSNTAYLPIQFGKETVRTELSTCVRICEMARLFVAIPHLLLGYYQCSDGPESPGQISSRLSLHNCQSHSVINTVYMIIQFLCLNMRHRLTD